MLRVFFLSTGRCGTQWLTEAFNQLHPHVDCRHEALTWYYHCKKMHLHPSGGIPFQVASHFDKVGKLNKTYIETGWPCFTAMRAASRVFGKDFRVIHLRRDQDDTALSMCKLRFYNVVDMYLIHCLLDPTTDRHTVMPPDNWKTDQMARCMWLWEEMTHHHTVFTHQAGARGMTIDYNDLFYGDAFNDVCEWLGLERKDITELKERKVDNYGTL